MAGVVLIAGGVFIAPLLLVESNPYNECRKRIKVGMRKEEAVRILEEYQFGECEVRETNTVMLYSYEREGEVDKITLLVRPSDGRIKDVEVSEVLEEGTMTRLWRRIKSSF
jgi:hypothetical protein